MYKICWWISVIISIIYIIKTIIAIKKNDNDKMFSNGIKMNIAMIVMNVFCLLMNNQ